MENQNHIQGAFYQLHEYSPDYFISLDKETLKKIKQGNIVKSKIVYYADKDINKYVQKNLFLTLLTDEERRINRRETKIIRTPEKVGIKISNYLLDALIDTPYEDYEHRYDTMGNKIHFLTVDSDEPFNEKSGFDITFKACERENKKQPVEGDLFESDYIQVYNSTKNSL